MPPIALLKENNDSLYLGKWLLCEHFHHNYGRHIEIQDGRHIIRHAVFKERQMSLTLSVVTETLLYLHFVLVQMAAILNFTLTAALPVLFSVVERIIVPVAYVPIASPTTLAKWDALQVCLNTIANPIAILSINYLHMISVQCKLPQR